MCEKVSVEGTRIRHKCLCIGGPSTLMDTVHDKFIVSVSLLAPPPFHCCWLQTKFQESSEEGGAPISSLLCLSPHITEILEQGLIRCAKVTLFSLLSLLASWYDAFSVEQKPRVRVQLVCACVCLSVCLSVYHVL